MLLSVLFFLAVLCSAQDLDSAARELARKIADSASRQDVASLNVRNASSLSAGEAADITRVLEAELRIRPGRPGASVHVTLSENVQSYLWIAEIRRGDERAVTMLSVGRPAVPVTAPAAVAIQKKLLWEQERPILDAAIVDSVVVALEPAGVSFYRGRQLAQWAPIPAWRPMPRDARGRLVIEQNSFRAYLPGVICTGSLGSAPVMSCGESSSPWPLDGGGAQLAAGRNYFTAPRLGSFFSSATLPKFQLAAGLDGRTRVYDNALREVSVVSGWGSDIAAVESGCGALVLATQPGDGGATDSVQAYEVTERRVTPAGDPATFSGPVVALWPSGRKGEAVVTARNSETGRYAAYSLAITCDR